MVYRAVSKANGAAADGVLGQLNFTGKMSATAGNGMYLPRGVTVDTADNLWVADNFNNRVLRFDGEGSTTPTSTPTLALSDTSGAPGSVFACSIKNLPSQVLISTSINNKPTGSYMTDSTGSWGCRVATPMQVSGITPLTITIVWEESTVVHQVRRTRAFNAQQRISATFEVRADAPLRTATGTDPLLDGTATTVVMLPLLMRTP